MKLAHYAPTSLLSFEKEGPCSFHSIQFSSELNSINADFVLADFPNHAKLSQHFTIGYLSQSSLSEMKKEDNYAKLLSYDAYLVESHEVLSALKNFLWQTQKQVPIDLLSSVASSNQSYALWLSALNKKRTENLSTAQNTAQVEYIVRTLPNRGNYLKRALESLSAQTHQNIKVQLVTIGEHPALQETIAPFKSRMEITVHHGNPEQVRSTHLWDALKRIKAPYFAILDDDDRIFPNHVSACLSKLEQHPTSCAAYGGVIQTWESDTGAKLNYEASNLVYCQPYDIEQILDFKNYITSNCYVARSTMLDENLLLDPNLNLMEDGCLLFCLAAKADFAFTYEVSSEYFWRESKKDNSSFQSQQAWGAAADQLLLRFWNVPFKTQTTMLKRKRFHKQLRQDYDPLSKLKNVARQLIKRD